jgi:Flp pilus assembly protein protease CpaA
MLGRPEVTGRDLLAMLATPTGWRLALNQVFVVVVAAGVFAVVAGVIRRLWSRPRPVVPVAAAPAALAERRG